MKMVLKGSYIHLGYLHALYQILIKAPIRIFESQSIFRYRKMAILQDSKSVLQFFHSLKVQMHVLCKSNFVNYDKKFNV